MDNENSQIIRKQIVDETLPIYVIIFKDDIEIGLPLLKEAYREILGADALTRIITRRARALYKDYIEDCIDTRQLIFFIEKLLDLPENKDYKENGKVQRCQENLKVLITKLDAQEVEEDRKRRNDPPSQPPLPRNGSDNTSQPTFNPPEKLTWKQILGGAMTLVGVVGLTVFATTKDNKEKNREANEKDT